MEPEKKEFKTQKIFNDSASQAITKNLNAAGAFITDVEAHNRVEAYLNEPGVPHRDDPNHVFGHVFGLDKIRSLFHNIDRYNAQDLTKNPIVAIRIYHAKGERNDPDFQVPPKGVQARDLVLVPVLKNGHDLFDGINTLSDPTNLILAESRPCPTLCN